MLPVSEKEIEDLCNCGKATCCKASVNLPGKGDVLVRGLKCKYLMKKSGNQMCSVYEKRFDIAPWCLPLMKGFEHNVYPSDGSCGYVLSKSYKGKQILSDQEYSKVEPQIIRSFLKKGQPDWCSDEDWLSFIKKAVNPDMAKSINEVEFVELISPFDLEKARKEE